ncbi:hypothetical protein J2S58_000804 [Nakamurella flavida]|nr:hypothetical protein [Nakamurella flavida]
MIDGEASVRVTVLDGDGRSEVSPPASLAGS